MRLKVFLASLLLSTTAFAGPSLHYDFLSNPSLTSHPLGPDLSITRATKASMTDADGYIREVQAGEARFTGATWSENRFPFSGSPANSGWLKVGAGISVTDNDGTDPDGGSTAASISAGANDWYWYDNIASINDGKQWTISVWVKRNTGSDQTFRLFLGVNNSSVFTATDTWQRFDYTAVSSNGNAGVRSDSSAAAEILVWHPQLESASSRTTPTDYINTGTGGVAKTSLTGTSTKGLLVEEARTNISLQSEDFGTTWVILGNSAINTNQTASPDGATTADQLIDNAATGTGGAAVRQNLAAISADTDYTYSVFLKADQLNWASLETALYDATGNGTSWFDLNNGVVGTKDANHSSSGIEDYGNGWYRCWVVYQSTTDVTGRVIVNVATADGNNTVDLDGTSSIFVWGAVLEAGAEPSSYIATTTTSVTRNVDNISTTDVSWYTVGPATWYLRADAISASTTNDHLYALYDGSNNRAANLALNPVNDISWFDSDGASFGTNGSAADNFISSNTLFRVAVGRAENDCIMYADGNAGNTDTSTTAIDQTVTTLGVGGYPAGSNSWNGHIAEIAYWPERLSNQILDDISTTGSFPVDGKPSKAILRGLTVGVEHDEILCSNSDPDDMPVCYASNGSNVQDIRIHPAWSGRAGVRDSGREGAISRGAERDLHDLDRVVGL